MNRTELCVPLACLMACAMLVSGSDAAVVRRVARVSSDAENLLVEDAWHSTDLAAEGFTREGDAFVCDNGDDAEARRGVNQTVTLNQDTPRPIAAEAWSKAEGVGGTTNAGYSLYLDIIFTDGTPSWGNKASFSVGTHDWERRQVTFLPPKPIKEVRFFLLLRGHAGKAWFRAPVLHELAAPEGSHYFDGVPVISTAPHEGFSVRDVAAGSDYHSFDDGGCAALDLELDAEVTARDSCQEVTATLRDTTGGDRAVSLAYSLPIRGDGWQWFHDPRTTSDVAPGQERFNTKRLAPIAGGHMSLYPIAAVGRDEQGIAIGLDMSRPALFRGGISANPAGAQDAGELYVAYDLGLAPEGPPATVRFVVYDFDAREGFRGAWQRYMELFPEAFVCRTPEQGIWMPFSKISEVQGWEDFGFKFKEGNNETAWDDAHDIITFRYTGPMTTWLKLPEDLEVNYDNGLAHMQALAGEGNVHAQALASSVFEDEAGRHPAYLSVLPWSRHGVGWRVNGSPGIEPHPNYFDTRWNAEISDKYYGPERAADLDGEYIDTSEGTYPFPLANYIDFRREHFSGMTTPLTFSAYTHRPVVFGGCVSFEYAARMSADVHAMGKLMMANGTPSRLCWLAPTLDVMGNETNWNRPAGWRPMSDADLLYRRALCGPKPFCFLMNTDFSAWTYEMSERFMKRCLAYGVFPGFFSEEAAGNQYFTRPNLYNRDRPLFLKYIPLVKLVAQAGWRPVTGARSSDPEVYVERFGERYLTVFNDSDEQRSVTVTVDDEGVESARDLVTSAQLPCEGGEVTVTLGAEDVALIDLH